MQCRRFSKCSISLTVHPSFLKDRQSDKSLILADPTSVALVYGTTYTMAGFRLTITDNTLTGSSKAAYTNATYIGGPLVAGSQMTYTVDTVRVKPTANALTLQLILLWRPSVPLHTVVS